MTFCRLHRSDATVIRAGGSPLGIGGEIKLVKKSNGAIKGSERRKRAAPLLLQELTQFSVRLQARFPERE